MQAKRIDGQAVNGKRSILADVIPLDTPYAITFFPIYACNFKCNYCIQSLNQKQRGFISDVIAMDFEVYKKCIDEILMFPKKLKAIHFAGLGEPLLSKDIVRMVKYAAEKNAADIIDIVTNGALLTPELSEALIDAGLDKIRISVQGLDAEKYKEVSDVKIDFNHFVENIKYFYDHRKNTKIYIKIMDISLENKNEKEFFNLFENICDNIAIEHLCPFVGTIDYDASFDHPTFIQTMNGNMIPNSEVYPQPFYSLQVYPDGNCIPCCTVEKPIVVGNCKNETLYKIWNSKKLNDFRKMQINKNKNQNPICAKCEQYKYSMFPEEVLDSEAERLAVFFK